MLPKGYNLKEQDKLGLLGEGGAGQFKAGGTAQDRTLTHPSLCRAMLQVLRWPRVRRLWTLKSPWCSRVHCCKLTAWCLQWIHSRCSGNICFSPHPCHSLCVQ